MNYNHDEKLENLNVGDTLTLEDGSVLLSVPDVRGSYACDFCALVEPCSEQIMDMPCVAHRIHFISAKP